MLRLGVRVYMLPAAVKAKIGAFFKKGRDFQKEEQKDETDPWNQPE